MEQTISDEQEILKRIVAGETELYGTIVSAYQPLVYGMLCRQVLDKESARDLCQEVFLRAYRGLAAFQSRALLRTWLIRITLNVASSYFSSRSFRESRITSPFIFEMVQATSLRPDALLERGTVRKEVRASVGRLKCKYREVVVLCAFESYSYEEAASILGIPVGTVCSRMNTALNLLRKDLRRFQL